ncbi:MAG TPA: TraR/DksA C4-type zinc finger protein [Pirellulales bacterium]|jgi:RNA polymerase-binding protein DksA|nr:TraR/DksA C4-type zinc finger protein [Pirellulales bacterium]
MKAAELEQRKKQLLALRDRLTGTLRHVEQAALEDVQKGGEISGYHTHLADADEEGLDKEIAIAANEEGILEMVEDALQRIEEGTYGTCEECGQPIPTERLEAIPYTPHCVQCAQ